MAEKSAVPTRKVGASGISGAIVTVLVWILEASVSGLEFPAEVTAALTTIVMVLVAYLVPDKVTQVEQSPSVSEKKLGE